MGEPLLERELEVQADYGQIYVYDLESPFAEMDDLDLFTEALDDAHDSGRFVGYLAGLVDIVTPSQFNWNAPLRLVITEGPPPLDADEWDHVVEVPLPAPSGRLCFEAAGGGEPIEVSVPPGTYRARFSGRGYSAEAGEIEGNETYRLELWPAEESEPLLLKYWAGFDLQRPAG